MNYFVSLLLGVVVFCAPISAGFYLGSSSVESAMGSNSVEGYHCQPIQKVETLKEAKAIVKQYQAMVRGS